MSKRRYTRRDSGLLLADDSIAVPQAEPPKPWYAQGLLSSWRGMGRRRCCSGPCACVDCKNGGPANMTVTATLTDWGISAYEDCVTMYSGVDVILSCEGSSVSWPYFGTGKGTNRQGCWGERWTAPSPCSGDMIDMVWVYQISGTYYITVNVGMYGSPIFGAFEKTYDSAPDCNSFDNESIPPYNDDTWPGLTCYLTA